MKIIDKIGQLFGTKVSSKTMKNAYNEAFFEYIGETGTGYDTNAKSYIDHGYNVNSIVYSIVNQQARKSAKVPFYIKKVDDEQKAKQFLVEIKKENIGQPQVKLNAKALEKKAFSEVETMDMPIEKPNIFQSWGEFISLYKTFLKLTGNVYIYMMAPENGVNAGAPMAFYLLPSHLIDIVLKPGANLLIDDSPIDYYRLIEGAVYQDFPAESVVHIKYSNPNFDINGSHLYGQSPLKSALKNIESANEALTQNIKTLKNSGAFGFIHGKQQPLNPDQAQELKDRLREMDNSPERLSNIAGVSAEVGFTRLTLTTDELQPFAYLSYDEKQLCNVLGWSDKLLNNDAGAKYSNIQESRKQVVTDDIMPDLGLLEQAFNDVILPKYTKYANTMLYFDVSTLPEMQLDMASLTSWLTRALKDGVINRNEYREALNYPILDEDEMDVYTVSGKLNPLERALEEEEKPPMPGVPGLPAPKKEPNLNAEKKNLITNEGGCNTKGGFNPNQARGADGKWGVSGVSGEFLGYHSTNSDLDGLTPGEVLSPDDYEDVLWRTYTEYFYDTGELVENRDIDGIAEWFEENGYSFTYVSSEPIMGSAYQASKYKYGENLFKVFGDGKELLMDDYNELNATIILSKNPLFFERVDEEKTGIVERMIKALDLDGEPGDITIKAGFNPNQQRNDDGTWGSGGNCTQTPINNGLAKMSGKEQEETIKSFTHYKSGENYYPRTTWANWFLGEDAKSKDRIAYEIDDSKKLQSALKSSLHDFWTEKNDSNIGFDDFLKTEITVFRGVSNSNQKFGNYETPGFISYALNRALAEKHGDTGEIIEKKVKVKDLYGAIQIVGGEIEVLEPTGYSDEFAHRLFNELGSKFFNLGLDAKDEDRIIEDAYKVKDERGYNCAYQHLKNQVDKYSNKKSIADIINQKAGFKPGQARDKDGKWADKWAGMKTREQEIKDQKKETALIYDADGNLLQEIGGSETHVEIPLLQDGAHILTHNHPNSSSFSRADILFLTDNDLGSIRAIGPSGNIFEMTLKKEFFGWKSEILTSWSDAKELADAEVKSYLVESLGKDWETPYWRVNENKVKTAQKVFGRWSDRVNWHLANSTEFGNNYLTYKTYKP